jgi:hypothetical protein
MKKSELINQLGKIEGDPEVIVEQCDHGSDAMLYNKNLKLKYVGESEGWQDYNGNTRYWPACIILSFPQEIGCVFDVVTKTVNP